MMKSLPCVNTRVKYLTKSITKYPISNIIIAKCHFILPFSATWMYAYQYFLSCALSNTHSYKHSYTKMYQFCRVFYQYINTSIHCMFTVEPLITFLTSSYSRGKEKTSSVTFYNISLHEKWILVRTPGNLRGLLLLLLQLYFLLTSRLFRS